MEGNGNAIETRLIAEAWAEKGMTDHLAVISAVDQPYVRALLAEVALLEQPIKTLSLGINENGDHYTITAKGFKKLLDVEKMHSTFLNKSKRAPELDNVRSVYVQTVDNIPILVISLDKVRWQTPSVSRGHQQRGRRAQQYEEDDTLPPLLPMSKSSRFRKRE